MHPAHEAISLAIPRSEAPKNRKGRLNPIFPLFPSFLFKQNQNRKVGKFGKMNRCRFHGDYPCGQCCLILARTNRTLSSSWSMPSTPSSMLIQLSNPTLRSSPKIAS